MSLTPRVTAGRTGAWLTDTARRLSPLSRRGLLVAWDCMAWVLAVVVFTVVRYDITLTPAQWTWVVVYTVAVVSLQIVLGLITHLYLGRSRLGSFSEVSWLGGLVVLIGFPVGVALSLAGLPRGLAVVVPPIALVIMAAGRWAFRMAFSAAVTGRRSADPDATPALVYGAGDAGHQVAMLVDRAVDAPYSIAGFLDDDAAKRFLRVGRYRVLGTGEDLVACAADHDVETIILAISQPDPQLLRSVSHTCEQHGLKLVVIPAVREMIGGRISLEGLRTFNVADLLGRRPISTDLGSVAGYVTGKVVLVTGAGGSIGSELALQLHKFGPERLVLLDRDESALHAAQLAIYGVGLLDSEDMVLCDIRDPEALRAVFEYHCPDVVFHAAALKHLPMLERFPWEGWNTNVLGTLNVLRSAHATGATHFVNVSTDKAADASSTLGRTKRVGERLTSWFAREHGLHGMSVRFGNVLGSRGSVLYTFRAQIARGGPLTITHPDVTRYFMTIPEACELVLQAGAIGHPGDVLVLDMGEPVRIVEVAERLIAEAGADVEIHYTGLRSGEKLHEVLFSSSENETDRIHPLISQVSVPALDPSRLPTARVNGPDASLFVAENLDDPDVDARAVAFHEQPASRAGRGDPAPSAPHERPTAR